MTLTELLQHFDREHPQSRFTIRRHPEAVGVWVASAYIWQVQDTDPATAVRDLWRLVTAYTIKTLPDLREGYIWSQLGVIWEPVSPQVRRYAESIGRPIPAALPPPFSIVWSSDLHEKCLYIPKPEVNS